MVNNAVDDNTILAEDEPSNFSQIPDKIDNAEYAINNSYFSIFLNIIKNILTINIFF
jgi:hypothetical protein